MTAMPTWAFHLDVVCNGSVRCATCVAPRASRVGQVRTKTSLMVAPRERHNRADASAGSSALLQLASRLDTSSRQTMHGVRRSLSHSHCTRVACTMLSLREDRRMQRPREMASMRCASCEDAVRRSCRHESPVCSLWGHASPEAERTSDV